MKWQLKEPSWWQVFLIAVCAGVFLVVYAQLIFVGIVRWGQP